MNASFTSLATAVSLLALSAVAASSQAAKRPMGDTLRFVATSRMTQEMAGSPVGPVRIMTDMYFRTVVVFGPADTIRTWTDSVNYNVTSPLPSPKPDLSFMLNKVDVGVINPDGSVTQVSEPHPLPDAIAAFSGFMPEDDATFPIEVLPPERLRAGAVWTDTLKTDPDSAAEQKMTSRSMVKYHVVGDSTIHGVRVVVIESESSMDVVTDMEVAGGMMTMKGTTKGTGTERKFYSPDYRMYLMETSTGSGTSTQEVGGRTAMKVEMKHTTESDMRLIVPK